MYDYQEIVVSLRENMEERFMRQILLYLFLLIAISVSAEQFLIKGKVVDENNEPMIGATVYVKGTSRGTATDINGNYSIVVEKGAILKITYVGYYEKEIEVLNDSSLIIESRDNRQMIKLPVNSADSLDDSRPKSEPIKLQN